MKGIASQAGNRPICPNSLPRSIAPSRLSRSLRVALAPARCLPRLLLLLLFALFGLGPQAWSQACTGLCLQQVSCPNNGTTSITGTVYAPNGTDPLPNVLVYIPNAPVAAFTPGVSCDPQGTPASGSPLVSTFTAVDGTFTLNNVPVGSNIPVVIQTGRWRRQLVVPTVTACISNVPSPPAGDKFFRLPKTKLEGDIPKIVVVTGSVDGLECVLRKIGIADTEFTDPKGTGRVNFYTGDTGPGAQIDSSTPDESALWTANTITGAVPIYDYDLTLFPCQGEPEDLPTVAQQNVINYANAGGRIFATHYSYDWLFNDTPFSGVALWDIDQAQPSQDLQAAYVNQTFSKGAELAQWLQKVGASTTLGQIPVNTLRHDQDGVNAPTQSWLSIDNPSESVQFTFNTPVGAVAQNQCGRVLFNEYHVENLTDASGDIFPSECSAGAITPQERLLEYSIFDLSTSVSPDTPPTLSVGVTSTPTTFTQGDTGDTISVNVTNTSTTDPTNPSLSVAISLPAGIALAPSSAANPTIFGTNSGTTGWNCDPSTLTCNRTAGLSANTSDPITLLVNVSPTAAVGLQSVSATASGGGLVNSIVGSDSITVEGVPVITWVPAGLVYGTPLGAAQLNATANIAGTFVYTPGTGALLLAGNQSLSAVFTPSVPYYVSANASAVVSVSPAVVSATYSSLVASPNPAVAGSSVTVTATVKDANNNPIAGATIQFGLQNLPPKCCTSIGASGVTDANGVATTPLNQTFAGTIGFVAIVYGNATGQIQGSEQFVAPAFTVVSNADPSAGNGTASNCVDINLPSYSAAANQNCELRDAVAAANALTSANSLGGVTTNIGFAGSAVGTAGNPAIIQIAQSTPITINQSVNINGPGAGLLTIEGGSAPYNGLHRRRTTRYSR